MRNEVSPCWPYLGGRDLSVNTLINNYFDYMVADSRIVGMQWTIGDIWIIYSEIDADGCLELDHEWDASTVIMDFNLEGKRCFAGQDAGETLKISDNQHNIYFHGDADAVCVVRIEGPRARSLLVLFSKEYFLWLSRHGSDAVKLFADRVAKDEPTVFSDQDLSMGPDIRNCIGYILNCALADDLKGMFMHSKAVELLALQAESLYNASHRKPAYIKKEYDRERILFARYYLVKHITLPPSLAELSVIAGINEFKLKNGFKEMFGLTVFGYLSEIRLELAMIQLRENEKSVTQIAFDLGYSSLQHFSFAFKKSSAFRRAGPTVPNSLILAGIL